MSLLTIAGVIAAAYIVFPYLRPAANRTAPPGVDIPDSLGRQCAVERCCELADFFEDLGDREAVEMCGQLADRIVAGDRITTGE